ncbi:MAG: acyltransferase family protein [Arcticibacter sp.]
MNMSADRKKLGLLQVFRGLAAVLVVAFHLTRSGPNYFSAEFLDRFFEHGDIGVDFFFVLSGFIITYVHFRDLVNRSRLWEFLKKRLIRIYPIYWLIATAYLFLLLFVANGKTSHHDYQIDLHSAEGWFYVLGCYLLIPQEHDFFLGVAWTLSYEMLFYLVFLLGIILGFNRAKYLFFVWAGVILLRVGTEVLAPDVAMPGILLLNVRILEFLTGCVVAYLILKSRRISDFLLFTLLVLGIGALFVFYPNWVATGVGILMLALINGLIVYKVVSLDLQRRVDCPRLLLLIGEASYSIYLSHIIFLSLFLRVFQTAITRLNISGYLALQGIYLTVLLLCVGGGVLIYRYVERPVLKYLNKRLLKKVPASGDLKAQEV